MAIVRYSREQEGANPGRVDVARIETSTDADIERFMRENGVDPDA